VAKVKANGIEIEYETAGNKSDPALLLVMGLGAQLTIWPDSLFQGLALRGFYVIRFDNRDTGLSTGFDSWGVPNIPAALALCQEHGLDINLFAVSYFLSREIVVPRRGAAMAYWRESLFATMSRNAGNVADFFRLPANCVIELGTRVAL